MGESQLEAVPPLEYLEQLGAYAISIGMPANEYWYGEPSMLNNYIEAEKIRQKKKNTELWLQGLYVYNAIGALVPVLNPFSKEHRAKAYLKKPIPLTEEEQQQDKIQRFVNYMMKRTEAGKK